MADTKTDADTDIVLANTDVIETHTKISVPVLVSANSYIGLSLRIMLSSVQLGLNDWPFHHFNVSIGLFCLMLVYLIQSIIVLSFDEVTNFQAEDCGGSWVEYSSSLDPFLLLPFIFIHQGHHLLLCIFYFIILFHNNLMVGLCLIDFEGASKLFYENMNKS